MAGNAILDVKLAGTGEGEILAVRITNPEEFGNLSPVASLPTPAEIYRNLFLRRTSDNTVWYLDTAGTGWEQIDTSADANTISPIAGETIHGGRAIFLGADGKAYEASNLVLAEVLSTVGISAGAAASGSPAPTVISGTVSDLLWTWTPGTRVYFTSTGALVGTAPASGNTRSVGVAMTATSLVVSLGEPLAR